MPAPASAFATLGLEPGADRAAIEAAYRRLIKIHHPDRSGGSDARAAEINRAYHQLCREPFLDAAEGGQEPSQPAARRRRRHRRRKGDWSRFWLVLATAGAAGLLYEGEQLERLDGLFARYVIDWRPVAPAPLGRAGNRRSAMRSETSEAAIILGVREAQALSTDRSGEALVERSRSCHRQLRREPSLQLLDQCAAFDSAVAALEDRPLGETGPFSPSALTARHTAAASLLSSDYLAIEDRLDRIRTRVDLMLAPVEPKPPATEPSDYSGAAETTAPAAGAAEAAGADLPSGFSPGAVGELPSDQRKLPETSNFST